MSLNHCVLRNVAYMTHSRMPVEKRSKVALQADRGVIKPKLGLALVVTVLAASAHGPNNRLTPRLTFAELPAVSHTKETLGRFTVSGACRGRHGIRPRIK